MFNCRFDSVFFNEDFDFDFELKILLTRSTKLVGGVFGCYGVSGYADLARGRDILIFQIITET